MDKITCDVIGDLLPLYAEEMLSEDSKALVKEHLNGCSECKNRLSNMRKSMKVPPDSDKAPLASIKKKLFRNKLMVVGISSALVVAMMLLGIIYVTEPIPLKYDSSMVSLSELGDGCILVNVGPETAGWNVSEYRSDVVDGDEIEEYTYHITLWDSLWNRYVSKGKEKSFVLNGDDGGGYRSVKAIYYYSVDQTTPGVYSETHGNTGDVLIFGNGEENIVTLPRLALSYYFSLAMCVSAAGIAAWIIFRKKIAIRKNIIRFTMLPIAYMVSQICVKGLEFASYTLLRDFTGILLLMLPIYCVLLIVCRLLGWTK
ncbi:MAG: zf-HC2 domain-containing protein [Clostridia bacterium]